MSRFKSMPRCYAIDLGTPLSTCVVMIIEKVKNLNTIDNVKVQDPRLEVKFMFSAKCQFKPKRSRGSNH